MIADHAETAPQANLKKLGSFGLMIGIVFAAIFAATVGGSQEGMKSYLYGYMFWVTLSLGMLGVTLLHHTVRGSWSLALLRMTEAGGSAKTFGALGLLFLPILFNFGKIYPWAVHDLVSHDRVLQSRAPWMNETAVAIRAIVLFLIWAAISAGMRASSLRQDKSKDFSETQRRMNYAAPGLVLFVLTVTCMATDWVMSVDPHWYSTMFGPLFVISGGLLALGLTTLVVCVNRDKEPFRSIISPDLTKDLGNMIFVFTMLWGYFNFSQFLIIWNGNLPVTAGYYFHRSVDQWNTVGCALILGRFFVPWFALLSPRVKSNPHYLAIAAGWTVSLSLLDIYYIVVPMYRTTGITPQWMTDLPAFLAVGGFWIWAFCSEIGKANLYPVHDMRLMEAGEHHG